MSSINRWQAKLGLLLLWCVTFLTPLVIGSISLSYQAGIGWEMEPIYYFLFGSYSPPGGAEPSGWMIGPMYVAVIFMLLLFFVIYALQVTYYCIKPTAQRWTIISGILSLVIPIFFLGISFPFEAYTSGIYAGPLPFQFILGLVVIRIVNVGIKKPEDELLEKKPPWWQKNQTDSDEDKQ
ncbi:MAG: hypothetical protein OEV85_03665 [Candidatus Thorarchaeota archaeon]|nr:hypothetical protein [Candidatus Thorarchaeota archaeon]